uniref:Ig-like domain-containing protein n=1 Tax=Nothobranchius korthausae TaxID=1143690 RepID=A0A1A8F6M7_9TELE
MLQVTLLISLLLVHHTTQSHEVQKGCGEDAQLWCSEIEDHGPGMDFIAVAWYKVEKEKWGILRLRKDEPLENAQTFDFRREAMMGEKYSLVLPRVTPNDSGFYQCDVNAKVGGQNKERKVQLTVHECVPPTEPTQRVSALNVTQPTPPCSVMDMPIAWSLASYGAVAVVKIILSLLSIWVIRIISSRSQRSDWCS